MRILILTPYYNTPEVIAMMCVAIDKYTVNEYHHIIIDDNSKELCPIPSSRNRTVLAIRNDIPEKIHKNQLGQAVQMGYDWAMQKFCREEENQPYDHVFLIESDCFVMEKGWDQAQIDAIKDLPADWGTLDVQSVNEEGNVTYPTTHSTRLGFVGEDLEKMEYPDFQCTLFNSRFLFDQKVRFSDFPSHFDILFGRKMTEYWGVSHYRTKKLKIHHLHGGGSSRDLLPKE